MEESEGRPWTMRTKVLYNYEQVLPYSPPRFTNPKGPFNGLEKAKAIYRPLIGQ